MGPPGLEAFASVYVPLSVATALLVLADILLLGRRQHMAVMDAVWPLTMLYWGPPGLVPYLWFGRAPARTGHEHGHGGTDGGPPIWQAVFKGATHCGAGCALGDFAGDWIAFATGLALFGSALAGSLVLSFVLAYGLGVVFQFLSVAPMRKLGLREGVVEAVKIDTLSLLAYEAGMFAVMAGAHAWSGPGAGPASWSYWLVMQAAMLVGFATTYPVNWWLIRRGTKERM